MALPPRQSPSRFVIAPTEVKCGFLKSCFFVVAVFLWSNRVKIRINMHREATRNPQMIPWGWGEGRKKNIFSFPNILRKKYFYLSNLLNSNKIFLCKYWITLVYYCTKTVLKLQLESIWMIKYYFVIYLSHRNIALSLPYRPSLRF